MRDSRSYIPLAPIQEHFWTASEFGPADGSLTECVALRAHSRFDRAALEYAVCALLTRHEVLRSTIVSDRGGPVMCVQPPLTAPPLTWLDLADRPAADREPAMHEAVSGFAEAGADLATGPLLRFLVIRLDGDDHVFALAVHHLIADATAVRIILSEISRDYLAVLHGEPSPVPPPELQYGDFAAWERTALLPAAKKSDATFWRDTLHDVPVRLDLRLDHPRPPVKGTRGRRTKYRFADSIRSALLDFAREHRTTPYVASLAAFAALITRSAGLDDFVVGVLAANRSVPEVENLVGQFSNTLPLRITLNGDPGFAESTARCGRVVADAVDHSRLPLSRIVELAETVRDPSRTSVIQHLFLPKMELLGDLSFCGLPTSVLEVRRDRGRFDTIVEVEVSSRGAWAWVEYDTALYTDRGIAELMSDYERILAAWLTDPLTPVSGLPIGCAPSGGGPSASLAAALSLNASDTVLLHGSSAAADAVRAAAEGVGASVRVVDPAVGPPAAATMAVVPSAQFGEYVTNSSAHTLIVDDTVASSDLARLRQDAARRAFRLIRLSDGTLLTADFTGLPETWPILRGGEPGRLEVGESDVRPSPYTPGMLHVASTPTPLIARWNPEGDLELVDGVQFTARERAATDDRTADDPLLALMCELWAEALQRPEIRSDDDFFVVGGYSMIATRLIVDLNESFGITVRIRALFENPTPALLVSELRREHPHLDELLALVASAPDANFEADPATPSRAARSDEDELIPLLAAQRQLWLAEQANPGALTHTIPLLLRIDGLLDGQALCAAVADVVARQAGLRGTFVEVGGEPMQRIAPFRGFDVPVVDLRHLPAPDRSERNRLLEQETAYGGFDITTGPLVRAQLVRVDDDQHVLHLLFHHLVTDEVSMTVFMGELCEFYRARVEGWPARLPPLELGFTDLVLAEQDMLAGPEGERLRRFWTRTLADAPRLVVPTDHPRPEEPTFSGEFLEKRGPLELSDAIGELSREHRTTAFTVFCAVAVALLHRLTGQTDLIVGVPSENRARRGAELLIGCFLNVVPVRVDCSGDPTFTELLDRVGASILRSYEHQRLPFAEIVDAVRPKRARNTHPIYQVTCELQLADWMPLELPGCRTSYELLSHGTARYDMSFHTIMRVDGISVMLEVNTDLWNRETGLTRIDQVLGLLAQVASRPELLLSELNV